VKHRISLTEFGFLFSIFTAPWGPVIRYLGWLIAIIGLVIDKKRGRPFSGVLDPWISWPLLMLIFATLFSTPIFKFGLETWGSGVSMVLEFSFAIWLAAYVFQQEGALERWKKVWLAGIIFSVVHVFAGELSLIPKRLFSNLNTFGIYSCVITPFVLSLYLESRSKRTEWFYALFFNVCIFTLITSFTSSAWIGGTVDLILQLVVTPFPFRKIVIPGIIFIIFILVSFSVLNSGIKFQGMDLIALFNRELNQLLSFHDLNNFTNHRIHIWKGSWEMLKAKPLTGWGWGDFPELFASFHSATWDQAATGLKLRVCSAHSMYLNLGVYGGIPAIVLVLWIYIKSGFNSLRSCRQRAKECYLNCAIFSLIVGQLVYSMGGDMFSFRSKGAVLFWTLLGIGGMRKGVQRQQQAVKD